MVVILGACGEGLGSHEPGRNVLVEIELSQQDVHPGDVLVLNIRTDPSLSLTWGVDSILERREESGWKRVFYLVSPLEASGKPTYIPIEEGPPLIPPMGFQGQGRQTIQVPTVEPGRYRIRKDFVQAESGGDHKTSTIRAYAELRVLRDT